MNRFIRVEVVTSLPHPAGFGTKDIIVNRNIVEALDMGSGVLITTVSKPIREITDSGLTEVRRQLLNR